MASLLFQIFKCSIQGWMRGFDPWSRRHTHTKKNKIFFCFQKDTTIAIQFRHSIKSELKKKKTGKIDIFKKINQQWRLSLSTSATWSSLSVEFITMNSEPIRSRVRGQGGGKEAHSFFINRPESIPHGTFYENLMEFSLLLLLLLQKKIYRIKWKSIVFSYNFFIFQVISSWAWMLQLNI